MQRLRRCFFVGLNRTSVGLKRMWPGGGGGKHGSLNRTSVGLKLFFREARPLLFRKPQSNQRWIETSGFDPLRQSLDPGLNRTSVGLKPRTYPRWYSGADSASIEPAWD